MKDLFDCRYLDYVYSPDHLTSTNHDYLSVDYILYSWDNICIKTTEALTDRDIFKLVGRYDS